MLQPATRKSDFVRRVEINADSFSVTGLKNPNTNYLFVIRVELCVLHCEVFTPA